MAQQIQVRRDTLANWTSANPLPAQGELCLVLDNGRIKFGDGIHNWIDLDYFAADSTYTWDQSSASATWTINHGLARFPSVTIVDSTGREVEGDIQFTDADNITLSFTAAFSGKAYLN